MISKIFIWLCVKWFRISGWKVSGSVDPAMRQYVLVVAPHTSNIDFPIGVAARKILKINVKYLAKKELFRFPIKGLLYGLGGYPVNRSRNTSMVDQIAAIFEADADFSICVTPEGTRSRVETWKTGFYRIAQNVGVPILMVGFDYARKTVEVAEPFLPSGDMEKDFLDMDKFYEKIMPKHPENSRYEHQKTERK